MIEKRWIVPTELDSMNHLLQAWIKIRGYKMKFPYGNYFELSPIFPKIGT
jgi:hypothetical protein